MYYQYENYYDIPNDIYSGIEETQINEPLSSLLLLSTDDCCTPFPSVFHDVIPIYKNYTLVGDPVILRVTVFYDHKITGTALDELEDKMKESMLNYIIDMEETYNEAYPKLSSIVYNDEFILNKSEVM